MFGLLVVLWSIPFFTNLNKQKIFSLIFLLTVLYGIGMEFIQKYFTSDRNFDLADILADILGASLGLLFTRIMLKRIGKAKNKPL